MAISRRAAIAQFAASCALGAAFAPRALAETTQYRYDTHGRLVLVIFNDGSSVQYSYDAAGNRTQVVRASTTPNDTFTQTIQITGTAPVNLRTLANTAGYNGAQNATIAFELGSGVTITGTAGAPNGSIAIDSGEWPATEYLIALTLTVKNGGIVRGGGGKGGNGNGVNGGNGGDAIYCRAPMSIVFESGSQARGGGAGGGGGGMRRTGSGENLQYYGGGGGGGGQPNGPLGTGGPADDGNGANGTAGTISAAGTGGAGGTGTIPAGGNGGAYGENGVNGGTGNFIAAGSGGLAGYCVRKNGYVVAVTNNGTTSGTIG